jgi:hypothetical protein
MTKADAKKIAKVHMYSFFGFGDGFNADSLSPEDNQKISNEIRELCKKELEKLGVDFQLSSDDCVEAILNKNMQ